MKLIFIHGAGNTGLVWHYQTEYFKDSEAITLPGHPQGEPCTSVGDYAAWLHRYIREKGDSQPVLAGHSLGGAVALMYALNYPGELKALVLINTGARLRVRPDFLDFIETNVKTPDVWLEKFVEPSYRQVAPAVSEKIINKIVEVGPAVQLNDFRCCDKFDIMDKIQQITVPTLIISGTEDDMTPVKYARYFADKIAGSKLIFVEGGSHLVLLEKPDEVNRAIEDFLRGL